MKSDFRQDEDISLKGMVGKGVNKISIELKSQKRPTNVNFLLFTINYSATNETLVYNSSVDDIKRTNFLVNRKTVFLTHGYTDYYGKYAWMSIAYISGLDPAGLGFLRNNSLTRLAPTDASLVVVTHTSSGLVKWGGDGLSIQLSGYLGNVYPLGHYDFWPNGGTGQSGCDNNLVIVTTKGLLYY
ncbi:unnamed protein product [Oppiella nova]|uniref:Lipase domain-containing protein n=1 Tax=Oppiella nova TaxID=334625 RepID=A0A7R9QNM6_9ACAR|nr:unnamed protein product [Oppiella nova]CAG2169283.1 unnamed protein product [Oppiella nova]